MDIDNVECRRCATCHAPLVLVGIGVWKCDDCNSIPEYMYFGRSRKQKIEIVEV
jgi:ribosomal protein L37AE/L43A